MNEKTRDLQMGVALLWREQLEDRALLADVLGKRLGDRRLVAVDVLGEHGVEFAVGPRQPLDALWKRARLAVGVRRCAHACTSRAHCRGARQGGLAEQDRKLIFEHYLSAERLPGIAGLREIDTARLANETPLFAPADIEAVVRLVARGAVNRAGGKSPRIHEADVRDALRQHSRSIQAEDARMWIDEAAQDLGADDPGLQSLAAELQSAYPM